MPRRTLVEEIQLRGLQHSLSCHSAGKSDTPCDCGAVLAGKQLVIALTEGLDPTAPNPSKVPWTPAQCAYAMSKLCHKLILDGYVLEAKRSELAERSYNMECGRGFLTTPEVEASEAQTAASAATIETETEDLLS